MARKKQEIIFACEDCGTIPEKIKDKSTENWNVIPVKCPKCGGKIKIKF